MLSIPTTELNWGSRASRCLPTRRRAGQDRSAWAGSLVVHEQPPPAGLGPARACSRSASWKGPRTNVDGRRVEQGLRRRRRRMRRSRPRKPVNGTCRASARGQSRPERGQERRSRTAPRATRARMPSRTGANGLPVLREHLGEARRVPPDEERRHRGSAGEAGAPPCRGGHEARRAPASAWSTPSAAARANKSEAGRSASRRNGTGP